MNKKNARVPSTSLSELIKKFSKNDVIAEMEKEYLSVAAKNIPLSQIDDNSFVKRAEFPKTEIERISKSISEKGLFNPLVVRRMGNHYELILGRKRFFGAKANSLAEVPAVIRDVGDEETLLMLLADTRDQREANVVEMALIYEALYTRFSYSQSTLANLSHNSRSQVTNILRILRLPENVIREISLGELTYGHARAVASLSDEQIGEMVNRIHAHKLSVRETEEAVRAYVSSALEERDKGSDTERVCSLSGAKSAIIKDHSLTLEFASNDELNAFLNGIKK